MIKNKSLFLILTTLLLSGCVNAPPPHPTKTPTDYEKFCNVDMNEVVHGNYIVRKVNQKYFYITSNGNVYSKDELDKAKALQQANNNRPLGDQVESQFKSAVNGIAGFKIMTPDNTDTTDMNTAKMLVVRKFISLKNPKLIYCTARLESEDQPEKFITEKYLMKIENTSGTNIDIYNNTSDSRVLLIPLR